MIDAIVVWDMEDDPQGNVRHVAGHGITMEEVEEVLLNEEESGWRKPLERTADQFR